MIVNDRPDGQLLAEVASNTSEACFEELVRRHGSMVLGACQRMLRHGADAEDAAQAVFLILWKKAAGLRDRVSVAGWLHQAARNICLNANRARDARTQLEREAVEMNQQAPSDDQWTDIKNVLDDELERLPEKLRLPIILFHLEGRSLEEIATILRTRSSTVGTRLSRAREMLRSRLALRGVTISAAVFAASLTSNVDAAVVSTAFVAKTTQAASLFATGKAVAGGVLSTPAVAMAKGGLHVMLITKIKFAIYVSLTSIVLLAGSAFLIQAAFGMTDEQKKDIAALQGTWNVVEWQMDGQVQPENTFIDVSLKLLFDGSNLSQLGTAADGRLVGETVSYRLDPTTSPKSIDVSENGQTLLGIYELNVDSLKLCVDRNGKRPESFTAGRGQSVHVAERLK